VGRISHPSGRIGNPSHERRSLELALAGVIAFLFAGALRAEEEMPPIARAVGITQRLDAQVPLELTFRDEDGKQVRLGDCCGGKPTVLVLAYFRCPMLCTQVLNGLTDALRGVPFTIGKEFNVVTVSFDAREGPALAKAKKASYVEDYGRPGAAAGWHFLTGEQESIDELARAVGFRYEYDPRQDQFAHGSGIMLLTPQGRVARYFYGIKYTPRDLRLGLVEASENRIGSPADQVLLLCYYYDPNSGKYTPMVMGLVRLGGAVTLLVLVMAVGLSWWRERRRRAAVGSAVRTEEGAPPVRTADPTGEAIATQTGLPGGPHG
jgi:protein SCO1/2